MNIGLQNGHQNANSAYVLDGASPDDVSRAMIEGGHQKEAFYVFDMDEAYRRIQHFKHMMPRIQIFYAVKANDCEMMLKLAVSQGMGFDCASTGEIKKIRDLNVDPLLLLRIRVDSDCKKKLGEKFGCDFETEAVDLLEEAAALGLKVVGVAFHVGSICYSIDSHVVGLRMAKALFDHEARAGRKMKIVDIGGGFRSDNTSRIDQVMKSGKPVTMFHLNEGVHGSLRYTEAWHTVQVFKKTKQNAEVHEKEDDLEDVILWGPTCDSIDRIMDDASIRLPRCKPTDWLVFDIQGAYSFVFSTNFSCLDKPPIRSVVSLELWNKLKDSPAFKQSDFVLKPDLSAPLPLTLPPVPRDSDVYINTQIPTLLTA